MPEFNIGDKVYWKYRIGTFNRTRSGRISSIIGEIATVSCHNQHSSKIINISINKLTKNKIQ